MKQRKGSTLALGVNVTPQLIEAVLLQQGEGEVTAVRRFIRQRKQSQQFTSTKSLSSALPGLTGDDADYSLEIGGNGHKATSDVTFLASEFGGKKKKNTDESSVGAIATAASSQSPPFAAQLAEILDECKIAGYGTPRLAFCAAPPDVSYTEVTVPDARGKDRSKTRSGADVKRQSLLEALNEQRPTPVDGSVVGFVPLAPVGEASRYIGIVPEANACVPATLEALVKQERELPALRDMEAELSAYVRFARRSIPADRTEQITAIIRIGSEDTLILFFKGRDLLRFERLRSLTSYESPDTICSRVLLQQDEWKIGEIEHVLVLSEAREEQLLGVFRRYYADAAVETVHDAVTGLGVSLGKSVEVLSPGSIPAVIAAMRVLQDWDREDPELSFRLLPKKLRRDQKKIAVAWHTIAMMVVLMAVAFVLTWRYVDNQAEINQQREEDRLNPITLAVDNPALLKARVDSLKSAFATYTHALHIIDSLLVGSDRWTRLHERLTRSTNDIGRIWLTSVEPMGTGSVRIRGTATTRTGVAQFVRRHQGTVERASSVEIQHESRNITVYDFTAVAPVPSETPRVALYLQDVAAGHVEDSSLESIFRSYAVDELYAPGTQPASENR